MADMKSVADLNRAVRSAYTALLKQMSADSDRQISGPGSKKTRDALPAISDRTGSWIDKTPDGKPPACLVHFVYDAAASKWKAQLSGAKHGNRIAGTFNTKSALQGIVGRIIPVMRVDPDPAVAGSIPKYIPHDWWEWGLAFVFPDKAQFITEGTSGATLDLDFATGKLTSDVTTKKGGQKVRTTVEQPYVAAGLFKLVPDTETWSESSLNLTYAEATKALQELINVEPLPVPDPLAEDEADEDMESEGDEVDSEPPEQSAESTSLGPVQPGIA